MYKERAREREIEKERKKERGMNKLHIKWREKNRIVTTSFLITAISTILSSVTHTRVVQAQTVRHTCKFIYTAACRHAQAHAQVNFHAVKEIEKILIDINSMIFFLNFGILVNSSTRQPVNIHRHMHIFIKNTKMYQFYEFEIFQLLWIFMKNI